MSFCLALTGVVPATLSGCKDETPPKSAGDTLKSREPSIMKTLDKFEAPEPEVPDKTAPPGSQGSAGQGQQAPTVAPKPPAKTPANGPQ